MNYPWLMRHRALVSLATIGLIIGVLFAGFVGVLLKTKHRYDEGLRQIEPRYARLLGLSESGAKIDQLLTAQQTQLADLLYAGATDKIGADVQQKVRSALQDAGVNVQGGQVAPLPDDAQHSFGLILVTVNGQADLSSLKQGLMSVEKIRPRVFLTSAQIAPINVKDAQRLSVDLKFTVVFSRQP